jgi:hypothetical protein
MSKAKKKENTQKQKGGKTPTQIQIRSLASKPSLTDCMKQIRQREGREGKEGRESSTLKQVLKEQSLTTCLLCATEEVAYG